MGEYLVFQDNISSFDVDGFLDALHEWQQEDISEHDLILLQSVEDMVYEYANYEIYASKER